MFGHALREWRQARRLSQLDLALAANVSARHISFLETGRAAPSRMMVQHLSEVLDVPREARNAMLSAASFAAIYGRRALDDAEMAPVRRAIDWTLARHDPFPGLVIDRDWRVVVLNRSATALFGPAGLSEGDSMIEVFLGPALRRRLRNWAEVGFLSLRRLRAESAHAGGIPALDAAADRLAAEPEIAAHAPSGPLPPVIPAVYEAAGQCLSLFSTIAGFGTAEDIALADLRIELMFPADAATEAVLRHLDAAAPS